MAQSREAATFPEPRDAGAGLSRRSLLKRGMTGSAAAALSAAWAPHVRAASGGGASGQLLTRDARLMLINRITYGWSEAEGAAYDSGPAGMEFEDYLDKALSIQADPDLDTDMAQLDSAYLSLDEQTFWGAYQNLQEASEPFLAVATLKRAIDSKNQGFEKLVGFWDNHLNTYQGQEGQAVLKVHWDRDVLREHALAAPGVMLRASTEGASMLRYLDQNVSKAPNPNENYARELLELHTLGAADPYSGTQAYAEADVLAAAKALTGYTFPKNDPGYAFFLKFEFNPAFHVGGIKVFLGETLDNDANPEEDGQQLMDILLAHSATRRYVSWKLARWFLSTSPQETVVDNAASQFGSIKRMVKQILTPSTLDALGGTPPDLKLRRPFEFMVALMRATGITTDLDVDLGSPDLTPLKAPIFELQRLGNAPHYWPAPDGYTDEEGAWIDTVFGLWEVANKILAKPGSADALPGVLGLEDQPVKDLIKPYSTLGEAAARISQILTGGVMTPNELAVLEQFLADAVAHGAAVPGYTNAEMVRDALALGASFPSFLYY